MVSEGRVGPAVRQLHSTFYRGAALYVGEGREKHTMCFWAVLDGSARLEGKLIQRKQARWQSQGENLRTEDSGCVLNNGKQGSAPPLKCSHFPVLKPHGVGVTQIQSVCRLGVSPEST